jgi:hypothetical protein
LSDVKNEAEVTPLVAPPPIYGRTYQVTYGRTFDVIYGTVAAPKSFAAIYGRTFDVIYGRSLPF